MLIAIKTKKRWMTFETGKAGDAGDPEIEYADDKEDEKSKKFQLGFNTEVAVDDRD